MEFSTQYLILTIIVGLILGAWASVMADNRGRDSTVWFFLGFCFGILAIAVLFILPNLAEKEEEEPSVAVPAPEPLIEDPEMKDWYYLDLNNEQAGPVSFDILLELYENKKISSTTYVWCEGMEEWKTLEECALFTS